MVEETNMDEKWWLDAGKVQRIAMCGVLIRFVYELVKPKEEEQ